MAKLKAVEPPKSVNKLSIIVVEDHPETLDYVCSLLERKGHAVTRALTLREARQKLRQWKYDLLIADLLLPDGNGCYLIEAGLPHKNLFAVGMTGTSDPEQIGRATAAGFRHMLSKDQVAQRLTSVLEEVQERVSKSCVPLNQRCRLLTAV
jgi:CheY-like chemotaxis protein